MGPVEGEKKVKLLESGYINYVNKTHLLVFKFQIC